MFIENRIKIVETKQIVVLRRFFNYEIRRSFRKTKWENYNVATEAKASGGNRKCKKRMVFSDYTTQKQLFAKLKQLDEA